MSTKDERDLIRRVNERHGGLGESRRARQSSEERVRELAEKSKPQTPSHVPDNLISSK